MFLRHEALKQVVSPPPWVLSSHRYEMKNVIGHPVMRRGECFDWLDGSKVRAQIDPKLNTLDGENVLPVGKTRNNKLSVGPISISLSSKVLSR